MRKVLGKVFDFYLKASIHVSFAVFALVQMTFYFCHLPFDWTVSLLAFSGTLFSYNFIKYADYVVIHRKNLSPKMKAILVLSAIALVVGMVSFFFNHSRTTSHHLFIGFGRTLCCSYFQANTQSAQLVRTKSVHCLSVLGYGDANYSCFQCRD
ncbi:hypothetical protein QNH98_14390 [Myroides sp. mNGS23_01]|nr:hypothetical protein [Myroides sp. mNGS23_01]WHT38227.1 hypothetical protein QNH98_14390 [Myroides sp. mNGS23_01]